MECQLVIMFISGDAANPLSTGLGGGGRSLFLLKTFAGKKDQKKCLEVLQKVGVTKIKSVVEKD